MEECPREKPVGSLTREKEACIEVSRILGVNH